MSDAAQQEQRFDFVARGLGFGNAFSEFGSKRVADFEAKFEQAADDVIVTGRKFYSTGAICLVSASPS